jgi:hypothetical protein
MSLQVEGKKSKVSFSLQGCDGFEIKSKSFTAINQSRKNKQ